MAKNEALEKGSESRQLRDYVGAVIEKESLLDPDKEDASPPGLIRAETTGLDIPFHWNPGDEDRPHTENYHTVMSLLRTPDHPPSADESWGWVFLKNNTVAATFSLRANGSIEVTTQSPKGTWTGWRPLDPPRKKELNDFFFRLSDELDKRRELRKLGDLAASA